MTILHIIEPFASGVTTFLVHLVNHLPHHRHIILHGSRTSVDSVIKVQGKFPKGTEFIEWKNAQREISIWRDLKAFIYLFKIIKNLNPDFIHLHSSKAGFHGRIVCFLLKRKKSIYTPHSAAFLRTDISEWTKYWYTKLERFANNLNGRVICCCKAEQLEYRKIGINTTVINNGIPYALIEKICSPIVTIVFSGLITRQKNPTAFNQIAESLKSESNIEIIWIGDGELRSVLSSSNINITGWIERGEMSKLYQRASIYLSTSAWEGLPYGALEAMSASCCLILTPTGGHVDLVRKGENGFLFNTVEEAVYYIKHLLNDPKLITKMGKVSKRIVEKEFDAQQMADSYNQLYLNKNIS